MAEVVENYKALLHELGQLERKLQRKVIVRAAKSGARIIHADAQRIAPLGESGDLRRSLRVRAAKSARGGRLPKGTFGSAVRWERKRAFYGSFLELGTKYIEPVEYLREAAYVNQGAAVREFQRELPIGIREISAESRAKKLRGGTR